MTITVSANNAGTTFAVSIYNFRTQLVAAGGVSKASGSGTAGTYAATDGTAITSGGNVALGFNNPYAWVREQLPDGVRELCLQNNSVAVAANTSRNLRAKYSKSARFTGGSPATAQVPSATDEAVMFGGGTDAAPTMTQWMSAADNTYTTNIYTDTASPYGFGMFHVVTGSAYTTLGGHLIGEPIAAMPTADSDPWVWYHPMAADTAASDFEMGVGTTSSNHRMNGDNTAQPAHIGGFIGSTYSGALQGHVPAVANNASSVHFVCVSNTATGHQLSNPNITSRDFTIPILFGRNTFLTTPNGMKGFSTNLRMFTFQVTARAQLSLESNAATGDTATLGPNTVAADAPITIPWNNTAITG